MKPESNPSLDAESLTPKQKRFAEEYLIDLNATAAYKRAGYAGKGKTAEVNASRLLGNAKVAAYVQAAMDKRAKAVEIDAQYVLNKIKETVERCSQAVPVRTVDGETGEYKFDSSGVLKGCELLGKHLKMFTDKSEVSGPDGGPIQITEIQRKIIDPK